MHDELFKKQIDNIEKYIEYKNTIAKNFNIKKVNYIFFNPKKYIDIYHFDFYLAYCYELIKEWIYKNEVYTEDYLISLENLLEKMKIVNHLRAIEKDYLIHIKSVVFAKTRNLKKLIVDFPLQNKKEYIKKYFYFFSKKIEVQETAYYSFDNCSLFQSNDSNKIEIAKNSKVYISDLRIILLLETRVFNFYLKDINDYKIGLDYFEFWYKGNYYYLQTENKYEFYISFERIKKLFK